MTLNAEFLIQEQTLLWLGQFQLRDQVIAEQMLGAMKLVSRDEFSEQLQQLILMRLEAGDGPVGLYVEREVRQWRNQPNRLFKESRTKVKRAYGGGPAPVKPSKPYQPADVGSEGIVAQLVSEVCRSHPNRLVNQPGPNQIRKRKIRRFMLVTDFIGTGQRTRTYLQAAWRIRSVRSWWSYRKRYGLSFEVVAYSATSRGQTKLHDHSSEPTVSIVTACPTIDTVLNDNARRDIRSLCQRYAPDSKFPSGLGYGDIGALIAFAHGVPNNSPHILHSQRGGWLPLFAKRVTALSRSSFSESTKKLETTRQRLVEMRQTRLSAAKWLDSATPESRSTLLVLAAINRAIRRDEALSIRTGLTMIEVRMAIETAQKLGWLNTERRLTDKGQDEIKHVRRSRRQPAPLVSVEDSYYYPSSLRPPRRTSS